MTFLARRQEDSKTAADVMRILQKGYEANEPVILIPQRVELLIDHVRALQAEVLELQTDKFTSAIRSLVDDEFQGLDPALASSSCPCGQPLNTVVEKLFKQCDGCYGQIRTEP